MKKIISTLAVLGMVTALSMGCSDDEASNIPSQEGAFIDSAVEGLEYETATITGITDAAGKFRYRPGETIIFFVGDIMVGSCLAAEVLTPVDLVDGATQATHPIVTNITRFLLTLDDDADPVNGILITNSVRAAAIGIEIDMEDVDDDGSSRDDGSSGSNDSSGDNKSSGSGATSSDDNSSGENNSFEEEYGDIVLALTQNNTVPRTTMESIEYAAQHLSMTLETLNIDYGADVPSVPDQDTNVPSVPDPNIDVPSVPDPNTEVPSVPDPNTEVPSVPDPNTEVPSL